MWTRSLDRAPRYGGRRLLPQSAERRVPGHFWTLPARNVRARKIDARSPSAASDRNGAVCSRRFAPAGPLGWPARISRRVPVGSSASPVPRCPGADRGHPRRRTRGARRRPSPGRCPRAPTASRHARRERALRRVREPTGDLMPSRRAPLVAEAREVLGRHEPGVCVAPDGHVDAAQLVAVLGGEGPELPVAVSHRPDGRAHPRAVRAWRRARP